MLFEVPAKEGLVGKMKPIRNFLYAEIGGLQQCFYVEYHVLVYEAFGCLTGHYLYYCGKVARSNEQFGCIKGNLSLGGAVLMNQLDEAFEYFFFSADIFHFSLQEQMLCLVIEIQ